ncbi:hypothetical protein V6N13_092483 [Hibiscus sabdariffa]
MMKLANGLWCEDAREIHLGVVNFFQFIFSSSALGGQSDYVSGQFMAISSEECNNLTRWVPRCEQLASYLNATQLPQACLVADFVNSMGHWDLEKLQAMLPKIYVRRISALLAPSIRFGADVRGSPLGELLLDNAPAGICPLLQQDMVRLGIG